MKLEIKITLTSGGTVTITGEDLTPEGVHEVFGILADAGLEVEESTVNDEPIDLPLPGPITDSMKEGFVEGFMEGRPSDD